MKNLIDRIFANWKSTLAGLLVLYIGYLHHVGKIEIGPLSLDELGPAVTALILFLSKDWNAGKGENK